MTEVCQIDIWTYSVHRGGLMRCCTASLDDAMYEAASQGTGQPAIGERVRCQWHETWMIRGEDGVWKWDHP